MPPVGIYLAPRTVNTASVLCALKYFGRFLAGLCGASGKDFVDAFRICSELCSTCSRFGEEVFRCVCERLFYFAVAEAAAAIERDHRFAIGVWRYERK